MTTTTVLIRVWFTKLRHKATTSTKIIFAGTLFFSQAVHNIVALVEKFQRAQQENRLCKHVYTGGLLNYTACVNVYTGGLQ